MTTAKGLLGLWTEAADLWRESNPLKPKRRRKHLRARAMRRHGLS
jgi:hypothetical protein